MYQNWLTQKTARISRWIRRKKCIKITLTLANRVVLGFFHFPRCTGVFLGWSDIWEGWKVIFKIWKTCPDKWDQVIARPITGSSASHIQSPQKYFKGSKCFRLEDGSFFCVKTTSPCEIVLKRIP